MTSNNNLNTRLTVAEGELAEMKALVVAIATQLGVSAAPTTQVEEEAPKTEPRKGKGKGKKAAKREEFVTWLHESAEERADRKRFNSNLSAWMRGEGLVPSGAAWEAAKGGERSVKALKAMNASDGIAPAKPKADTPKAPKREVAAKVEADKPAKVARPHRVDGSFMNAEEAKAYHRLTAEHGDTKAREIVAILFS